MISEVGTRLPEVESGSTKAMVFPLISAMELMSVLAELVTSTEW